MKTDSNTSGQVLHKQLAKTDSNSSAKILHKHLVKTDSNSSGKVLHKHLVKTDSNTSGKVWHKQLAKTDSNASNSSEPLVGQTDNWRDSGSHFHENVMIAIEKEKPKQMDNTRQLLLQHELPKKNIQKLEVEVEVPKMVPPKAPKNESHKSAPKEQKEKEPKQQTIKKDSKTSAERKQEPRSEQRIQIQTTSNPISTHKPQSMQKTDNSLPQKSEVKLEMPTQQQSEPTPQEQQIIQMRQKALLDEMLQKLKSIDNDEQSNGRRDSPQITRMNSTLSDTNIPSSSMTGK